MRKRRWRLGLIASVAIVAPVNTAAALADEPEPYPNVPSVCAPPCSADQVCAGNRCVGPGARPAAQPPAAPGASQSDSAPYLVSPADTARDIPPAPAPDPPQASYPPTRSDPRPPADGRTTPETAQAQPPPQPLRRKRRLFAMPYTGVHSYQNSEASSYGPGLRVGALIGGRVSDALSLNGELTYDINNLHVPLSTNVSSETGRELALCPILQLPFGAAEVVLGMKLGLFELHRTLADGFVTNGVGKVAGIKAGVFLSLSPRTSVGLLASYDVHWVSGVGGPCPTSPDPCGAGTGRIVGLAAAAVF